jgi:hypothetical protein
MQRSLRRYHLSMPDTETETDLGYGFSYEVDKHVAVCVYVSAFEWLVTN